MKPRHATEGQPSQQELATVLVETYSVNDLMNQILLKNIDPRAWRAQPPGKKGSGRTIAAIFAHLHNSRLVWIKNSAPHLKCPKPLDPDKCTLKQAAAAHLESAEQCLEMLDLWREQIPHSWVTGDDELGRHTRFRQQLRARGERDRLKTPVF